MVSIPMERVPPQNVEAEQSVLGSMLLSKDAIDLMVDLLKPEDFYRAHRYIYEAMLRLHEKENRWI